MERQIHFFAMQDTSTLPCQSAYATGRDRSGDDNRFVSRAVMPAKYNAPLVFPIVIVPLENLSPYFFSQSSFFFSFALLLFSV